MMSSYLEDPFTLWNNKDIVNERGIKASIMNDVTFLSLLKWFVQVCSLRI